MSNMQTFNPSEEGRKELPADHACIAAVDCFPVLMKMKKPLVMSTYTLADAPVLFVRITTAAGAVGWGEAAANLVMSGETLVGMCEVVRTHLRPQLINVNVLEKPDLSQALRDSMYGNRGVLAAIDMALLDLRGKILGLCATEVMGGALRESVTVLRLVGGSGRTKHDVEETVALWADGYRAFKLKVGVGSVAQEIETVRLLRRELGPDALLAADANMGWDYPSAFTFVCGVAEENLAFLEQPFPVDQIQQCARLITDTGCPVSIDEAMHGPGDMLRYLDALAIKGVGLKTIKLGGVLPTVAVARTAHGLGLSVNLAMMMESSLATAAMVHVGCAIPALHWGLSLGSEWLANDPVHGGPRAVDGAVFRPAGIGLGVEVDEDKLRELAP